MAGALRAPEGFALFLVDPEGLVQVWSEGASLTYGRDASAVLGRITLADLSAGDGSASSWREALDLALSRDSWTGIIPQRRGDGTAILARLMVSPVRRQQGDGLTGFLIAARDVTGELSDMAGLAEERRRSRLAIDASPVPHLTCDLAGVIRDLNPAARALIGADRDQLVGRVLGEVFTEPQAAADLVARALRTGQPATAELMMSGPGGGSPASCRAAVLSGQDGRPDVVLVTVSDQVGRLAAQLREATEFSSAMLGALGNGMLELDAAGTIRAVSDFILGTTGLARSDIVGRPFASLCAEPGKARAMIARVLRDEPARDVVLPMRFGDDTYRHVAFTAWAQGGSADRVRRVYLTGHDVTDRVAEAERVERERSYNRGLIESSTDALLTVGFHGHISDLNGRLCEMLGKSRDELIGSPFARCFTEPGAASDMVGRALAGSKALNYELRLANEPRTAVLASASVYRDGQGAVAGVVISARDVTEQAELHEAVTAKEAYNRALMEATAEAFFVVAPDGMVTDVNEPACALTGQARGDLAGRPFGGLFEDGRAASRCVADAFAQGRVAERELTLLRGGDRVTVSTNAGVFRDPAGSPQGVLVTVRDVTARKRAEARLRAQQQYTRSLFDANLDALVATDLSGTITDANPVAEEITGLPREELIGSHLSALGDDPGRVREVIGQALSQGRVAGVLLTRTQPDGSVAIYSWSLSTFTDSSGALAGILGSARDVTESQRYVQMQRNLLEQAQRLDRAKTDLVSRVSHELRSPLTGVVGYLELLAAGRAGPLTTEQRRVVGIMAVDAGRLRAQIEDLLTMSRLDEHLMVVDRKPVDLGDLAREICQRFEPAVQAGGLRLEILAHAEVVTGGDPLQLERVISNLVSNAVKFTPPGGMVRVTVRREGGHVVLRVRDTGIGIPPGEQAELFTRFFRSSLSEEKEIRGTGIGLYIVRQIVSAHGGTIGVESAPGTGSTFTVRLPLWREPAPSESRTAGA